ncbi:MAG: MBOAT family protein [Bacillus sp. (in: Bacteria)]|nr:MBOAT family protein [Bacillus sp. (in: firmicutes)]MCM1427875.1 MBOAT family protein [Eubacterium sp.]
MLFSSVEFLFRFLPVFMLIYLLVPDKYRNVVLLSGSLVFYGVGEPYYVLLLILSIVLNYGAGRLILEKKEKLGKPVLISALLYNFGVLFLFKYWDFAAENLNRLFHGGKIPLLSLALPLGISFYTFQIASYLIDCYMGRIKETVPFTAFASYVTMFPQLIAGPIVKYEEVAGRMKERKIHAKAVESGFKLFSIGLGFKVLLANQIGTLWNVIMTAGAGNLSVPAAWMGAFAYSFQIYFDFWGYSLMAKGLGRMLGFRIPKNFNDPYMSKSISEFWRRWHITLGRWFKEYLYIPLGGNRKGYARTACNLLAVWVLTGLWHGAAVNFALWGLTFFIILAIEKRGIGKYLDKSKVLGHLYVVLVIPVTWMIFAISDMKQLLSYLQNMIGIHASDVIVGSEQILRYIKEYGVLFLLCILFSTSYPMKLYRKYKYKWYTVILVLVIFWFSVYEIMTGSNNPFLYFRF